MLNIKEFEEISYGSGVNGSGIVTLAAEVSPVAWVLSLAQEVQHAMHAAKKKKKRKIDSTVCPYGARPPHRSWAILRIDLVNCPPLIQSVMAANGSRAGTEHRVAATYGSVI